MTVKTITVEPTVPGVNTTPNPKDLVGRSKPDLALVSGTMLAHMASGLADGAVKYGVGNWREIPVEARTYISAAQRHLTAWMDREEYASDSGVHHLGHALATIGIVLDALACGTLIDNRARAGGSAATFSDLTARRKLHLLKKLPAPVEPEKAVPVLPPELAHPAARLATSAFAAEVAAGVKAGECMSKKACTSPGSCHAAQKCLGGPSCPKNEPEKPSGFGPEDFGGRDYP